MNESNIFAMLNQQYSLSSLVCLAEIFEMGKEKRTELEKDGYIIGYTKDEWEKMFPHIDPKNVFCSKSVLFPADLIYWERDHYICFYTHLYGANQEISKGVTEDKLLAMRNELFGHYKAKKWSRLLRPTLSEGSGNVQMKLVTDIVKNEEPSSEIYKLFIDTYTLCDAGCNNLTAEDLMAIIRCKGPDEIAETLKHLEAMPDPLTIYRGEGSKSTSVKNAFSWTLDPTTAYFFASWRGGEDATVWEAKVAKDKVVDYITDRKEQEIIVQYSDIFDVKEKPCVSWDMFLSDFAEGTYLLWDDYTSEPFTFNAITEQVANIYKQYSSDLTDHNRDHSIRVAMLAAALFRDIYTNDSYPEFSDYYNLGWDEEDFSWFYRQVITAAMWHDVGRTNDGEDQVHGALSYQEYLRAGNPENEVIHFLMKYYCMPDSEGAQYLEEVLDSTNPLTRKAFCLVYQVALNIIKDADALDRCRFGWLHPDFLNVSMLRTEEAKSLVPAAFLLCKTQLI